MPENKRDILRLDVISWALYDFANTIYSMNIVSRYFAVWLVVDLGYKDIHYSIAFSASMFLAAVLMPALGYLSDAPKKTKGLFAGQRKLLFLFIFTAGAVLSVVVFASIPVNYVLLILIFFAFSNFFYEGGIVFYNALLTSVSNNRNVGKVSGFGVALGYVGSIVGLVLVEPFVDGKLFFTWDVTFIDGWGNASAFYPTAIFFALFAVPIFLFVRERPAVRTADVSDKKRSLKTAYKDVWKSIKSTEKYPGLLRFLISDYFFEDAIATVIIFMAVFSEKVLEITDTVLTLFFIASTAFAILGAYILGYLADRVSPKKVLFGIVAGWIIVLIVFALNSHQAVFYICGPIVGILLGGVWSVSRPILIYLSPPEKLGEFFGLFSISGRAAAICGPIVWGAVVYIFASDHIIGQSVGELFNLNQAAAAKLPYRLAVLALAAMMALGLFIFRKVPETGRRK